jgi:hypothetical protein
MLVHIVHFAVELPGQPLGQALLGLMQIDIADACLLKTTADRACGFYLFDSIG